MPLVRVCNFPVSVSNTVQAISGSKAPRRISSGDALYPPNGDEKLGALQYFNQFIEDRPPRLQVFFQYALRIPNGLKIELLICHCDCLCCGARKVTHLDRERSCLLELRRISPQVTRLASLPLPRGDWHKSLILPCYFHLNPGKP
jgi:hypothetical protein